MAAKIIMYGAEWCPDCRRTKDFLQKNNVEYDYINVDVSPEASKIVEGINNGKRIIPTLMVDGESHTNPANHQLASLLGINKQGKVVLYGADWCSDCRRAKRFLQDNQVNYQFVDVDAVEGAADLVMGLNNGKRIIPTILINDEAYSNPNNQVLGDALNLSKPADDRIYDVVIIGGGAAGLTTAIYAQRDRYDALILERKNIGGNAFITKKIENYPGFKEVSGPDLMARMEAQAGVLGAKIETGEVVTDIEKGEQFFKIHTEANVFFGKTIVIATGSTYRTLNIEGEKELIGAGIHFCATCDGAFYRDKEVVVIGGGNSALEEGMFLASFVKKVSFVNNLPEFTATETYVEKLATLENVETYMDYDTVQFNASENGVFQSATIRDKATGETKEITADGVFIFIGLVPNTKTFKGLLNLSDSGHVLTKGLNQTNVEGIFAAGDVRKGAIAQVAAATGEGVVASYGIREYLSHN